MNVETTIKTIEHLYQAYIVANANKKVPILKLLEESIEELVTNIALLK